MKSFVTKRSVIRLLWVLGGLVVGFVAYAWRSPIPPIETPTAESFDSSSVRRGAQLAALGDCATCHTAPGGETFAGGRPVLTPFGTIYSTNITPDPTGIGHWSQAAFQRAMREGVDREGNHLYPAFPYDHFTLVNDADSAALYAFMMTRQPVEARTQENHLPFPLNMRFILAGWKLLFFHKGIGVRIWQTALAIAEPAILLATALEQRLPLSILQGVRQKAGMRTQSTLIRSHSRRGMPKTCTCS